MVDLAVKDHTGNESGAEVYNDSKSDSQIVNDELNRLDSIAPFDSGTATGGSATELPDTSKSWGVNSLATMTVIVKRAGVTIRSEEIVSNTADTITVASGTVIEVGDTYSIYASSETMGEQINNAAEKTTPIDADMVGLMDSAASNVLKKLSWANIKAGIFSAWGVLVAAGTGKTTPIDADVIAIGDSAASNATKKLTWANLKATLKTYFDTLYGGLSGSILQVANSQTGAVATGTTLIPYDDSIPQNDEGDQYLTTSITPLDAANTLEIDVTVFFSNSAAGFLCAGIFQDALTDARACGVEYGTTTTGQVCIHFKHRMAAGTTSPITFNVRCGSDTAGTTTFNGGSAARKYGGSLASSITVREYAA